MARPKFRVVRDLSAYDGIGCIYDPANGYFSTDPDAPEYQLGRELYDCQVLEAKLRERVQKAATDRDCGPDGPLLLTVTAEELLEISRLLIAHCRLIGNVGFLRADYSAALEVLKGRAEYREKIND